MEMGVLDRVVVVVKFPGGVDFARSALSEAPGAKIVSYGFLYLPL
jgi:hypothetical protein